MEVMGLLSRKAAFFISRADLFRLLVKKCITKKWKKKEKKRYLTGVRGLPMNLRGERIFGSKENFSFTLSSTDGATYVKPCKTGMNAL